MLTDCLEGPDDLAFDAKHAILSAQPLVDPHATGYCGEREDVKTVCVDQASRV